VTYGKEEKLNGFLSEFQRETEQPEIEFKIGIGIGDTINPYVS
jgi:hypothetical protein